jgi:lysophospholipase L1-like esterase
VKKEWLLLAGSVVLTLLVALGLIRWLAPHLLGMAVPVDRRVVQVAEEVPPFFDVVLPYDALTTEDRLVNDPYVGHRRAVMVPENTEFNAPFDLLGFRNRAVPVVADVITIGDSQTVGPNAHIDRNWPGQLRNGLAAGNVSVYNVSVGGWGAIQYLYMFDKMALLRPRTVVVAFYTGNDAIDSLHLVYSFDAWADLRRASERPETAPNAWPPKPEDTWTVDFGDGVQTGFTPKTRLFVNDRDYPGTLDGYRIMADVGARIDALAATRGISVIYTIIPTKELVYAAKVKQAGVSVPDDYLKLIQHETQNINELSGALKALPHGRYVDVAAPMQRAALGSVPLYPENEDGHPVAAGYGVISQALLADVMRTLPPPFADGIATLPVPDSDGASQTYLVREGGVRLFNSHEVFFDNGWKWEPDKIRVVTHRDLAGLKNLGVIREVDPARYGPRP